MNLSILFKFLNKSKENSNTTLASFKDLYQIPSIKDIKDSYLLEKIKNYQKNYWQIIHSKKTLTSLDFELDNTTKTMNMYIDLLLNTLLEEKSSLYKGSEERFSLSDALKMQMYLFDLNDLYIENLCRLIALNEIAIKAKFFISKNKLNALNEAIYTLIISQNNFETNKLAIKIKIENYLTTVEQENSELIKEEILEHIIYLAKNIIPDTTNKILNENYPPATTKALIERALEIYVYESKEEIIKLNETIDKISQSTLVSREWNTNYNHELRKALNQIEVLTIKYEVFDRFGHNLISQNYLNRLYSAKLFITVNYNFQNASKITLISSTTPQIELETYYTIIKNLIPIFISMHPTSQKYYLYKIFKNGKTVYDYEEILKNPILLTLCTLGKPVDTYFFDNYYLKLKDYPDLKNIAGIQFTENISLSTLIRIQKDKYNDLYSLYNASKKSSHDNDYHLPDGITNLNWNYYLYNGSPIIYKFTKLIHNKLYIFPNSLRIYCGPIFSDITIGCKLNYGLEYLQLNEHKKLKELIIPSTVKLINNTDDRPLRIDNIIFENYPDSELIKNPEALTKLIKLLFYCKIDERHFNGIETITQENKYKVKYNVFPCFQTFLFRSKHKPLEFYFNVLQFSFYEEISIENTIKKTKQIPNDQAKKIVLEIYKTIKEHSQTISRK